MASAVDVNRLWQFFHNSGIKQNGSHWRTHCRGCVAYHEKILEDEAAAANGLLLNAGTDVNILTFVAEACKSARPLRGEKSVFITHILGHKHTGKNPCSHAGKDSIAKVKALRAAKKAATEESKGSKHSHTESTSTSTESLSSAPPSKKLKQPSIMTHMYAGTEMPFSNIQTEAIQDQALRAVISANLPFHVSENPEVLKLVAMVRTAGPAIMLTAKLVGSRLLTKAADIVHEKTVQIFRNHIDVGICANGWKLVTRSTVNGIAGNVDGKLYTLDLIEVTGDNKHGIAMAIQFGEIIDHIEEEFRCVVVYLTTDSDGRAKKGRIILGKERPWMLVPSCWAHQFQLILGDYFKVYEYGARISEEATDLIGWINNHGKVRMIFDDAQKRISLGNTGRAVVLSYLNTNLTRWTTHCIAFMRLLLVKWALQNAVTELHPAIIKAQVGAATSTEHRRLTADAEEHCNVIEDYSFWNGLEQVVGDIEPICYGANINQKDSTRLDQILLTLAGMYLHFSDHPEPEVAAAMKKRLEKCWKDCDQQIFILALVLNPFEGLTRFGDSAGLNHIKLNGMVLRERLCGRPDNLDGPELRGQKERAVSAAFFHFLAMTGPFASWRDEAADFPVNPIAAWLAFRSIPEVAELGEFALILLKVVANQGGVERIFSDLKVKQTHRHARLGLAKLGKMTKVGADIKAEHQALSLAKTRGKRNNHDLTATLLAVPRYRDLLADQDNEDETEHRHLLVNSAAGWRMEMAKWVGEARDAEAADDSDDDADDTGVNAAFPATAAAWKPTTLAALFGGIAALQRRPMCLSAAEVTVEAALMEALADIEEDERLDEGAIEINSDDEFAP
ncbi:hypothetical protein FIBSPDRAFT_737980 [Athelia psychrophila]|uniref:DUF659 domain-containing protein n=1 Tax=Athelia psychrophila TaxID=1759441 RepID=A0A166LHX1_9AGAM|nr:hypothetical protein FIBSPDRAFT_737980 [Fibularhizoctonia sp. CBS 109695]